MNGDSRENPFIALRQWSDVGPAIWRRRLGSKYVYVAIDEDAIAATASIWEPFATKLINPPIVAPTMRSLGKYEKMIYVTRKELSRLKRDPTSMSALYGYERRVRDIEAGDMYAMNAARVPEGVPTLPANFTGAQLREYQNACANLKSSQDYESFRATLITGEINAKKALGFMHLAADTNSTAVEKDAYLTVARFIATARHRVRSSIDFTAELPVDVSEETRGRIMKLINQCGFTGSLRSAF